MNDQEAEVISETAKRKIIKNSLYLDIEIRILSFGLKDEHNQYFVQQPRLKLQ